MTRTFAGSLSAKAVAATLAAALSFTAAGMTPARADSKDAIAAAAVLGLIAAGIIATTRDSKARAHTHAVPQRVVLPAHCRFKIRHGHDRGTWYGRHCLSESNVQVWALPDRCKRRVELPRRHLHVVAYSAHCLTKH